MVFITVANIFWLTVTYLLTWRYMIATCNGLGFRMHQLVTSISDATPPSFAAVYRLSRRDG